MKIAWLGAANSIHTKRWVRALTDRGISVHLISQHPDSSWLSHEVASLTWLPHSGKVGYFLNAMALRGVLARLKPQVLNVHYASGYGSTAALVGYKPTLLSVWGSDVYDFPSESRLKRGLLRWNLSRATALASTSAVMAEQARRVAPHLNKDIWITPFGVDTEEFRPIAGVRDGGAVTIGTVKSLAPKYGVDVLIKAFALLLRDDRLIDAGMTAPLRLLIVGDGPQRPDLQALVTQLGICERVRFVGHVAHADVPIWLNRLDIFVAASRLDSESFGVAAVEASACALPVIVSDAGGLPEVVIDGVTGFVVPRSSPELLSQKLAYLLMNGEQCRLVGVNGRRHVIETYDWKRCVDTMIACYESLVRPL